MLPIVTGAEMRGLDQGAVAEYGIPSLLLMESAGAETVHEILAAYPDLASRRVLILCGRGNNGGDGFVVARRLLQRGIRVQTLLLARPEEVRGDAQVNLGILERLGAAPLRPAGGDSALLDQALGSADLVVDAMLGTGAQGPARGLVAEAVQAVNRSGLPVVAVDIPSGLVADSPEPPGPAVRADLTVTLALPKPCLVLYPAAALAGRVRVVDIGIPPALVARAAPRLGLLTPADVKPAYPPRDPGGHKGTFGHVLVLAGSPGKTGAAVMAAQAAQRAGAGLVTLGAPAGLHDILGAKLTEVMTEPLPETAGRSLAAEALEPILRLAAGKGAVAIGPGLGTAPETQELVRRLVAALPVPMVLDADGLNALAGQSGLLARAGAPVILTPHPGELARLLEISRDEVVGRRLTLAAETAGRLQVTLILKLARTLVADPGGETAVVPTGNPGMATGGSGDVLTGIVAGLLAQGRSSGLAARAGAYLHGLAGDLAARRIGQEALLATDLLDALPEAIAQVKRGDAPAWGE